MLILHTRKEEAIQLTNTTSYTLYLHHSEGKNTWNDTCINVN